ncbi:hypothetical protein CBQ28_23490 [Pseudoalteromonas sp. GCY]|uniref:hypothetical protein n=1 Tax=Pseudoalteromonas sp. GCY TaxID=2003316 RepID=UPI000BFF1097|nr:hypothetical protein [Pseudoalteromonas sp. GCY]PHI34673.1 hypothetical protein CBQ28_23490 [Pseudoalteromonas sp. GCY]QQQ64724.1 hypothetical protein JJQ94_03690 [Pseudoalteromonas sp. GCY]
MKFLPILSVIALSSYSLKSEANFTLPTHDAMTSAPVNAVNYQTFSNTDGIIGSGVDVYKISYSGGADDYVIIVNLDRGGHPLIISSEKHSVTNSWMMGGNSNQDSTPYYYFKAASGYGFHNALKALDTDLAQSYVGFTNLSYFGPVSSNIGEKRGILFPSRSHSIWMEGGELKHSFYHEDSGYYEDSIDQTWGYALDNLAKLEIGGGKAFVGRVDEFDDVTSFQPNDSRDYFAALTDFDNATYRRSNLVSYAYAFTTNHLSSIKGYNCSFGGGYPRGFVGTVDADNNPRNKHEKLVILVSQCQNYGYAKDVLEMYGLNMSNVMTLDSGGSLKLYLNDSNSKKIDYGRTIPNILAFFED